jgi:hypothetical protein
MALVILATTIPALSLMQNTACHLRWSLPDLTKGEVITDLFFVVPF